MRLHHLSLLCVLASTSCQTTSTSATDEQPVAAPAEASESDEDPDLGADVAEDEAIVKAETQRRAGEAASPPETDVEHVYGKFVRFELVTKKPLVAARFYEALFGWTLVDGDDDDDVVQVIEHDGKVLGRIRRFSKDRKLPLGWVSWISVENLDEVMLSVEANGGRILERPRRVNKEMRALLRGPTGGIFGIVHADEGDGPDRAAREGGWYWSQLWSNDFNTASTFYTLLGQYTTVEYRFEKIRYRVLESGGLPRAVVLSPPAGQGTRWLPFVRVADVAETVATAKRLHAEVIRRPITVDGIGRVAVLRSPADGFFGVITPPAEE